MFYWVDETLLPPFLGRVEKESLVLQTILKKNSCLNLNNCGGKYAEIIE